MSRPHAPWSGPPPGQKRSMSFILSLLFAVGLVAAVHLREAFDDEPEQPARFVVTSISCPFIIPPP